MNSLKLLSVLFFSILHFSAVFSQVTANDDNATTNEDTHSLVDILTNDVNSSGPIAPSTVDLDPSTVGIQSSITKNNATWSVDQTNGVLNCQPSLNFCGMTTITYTHGEGSAGGTSNEATVTITVNCVNDPPVVDNEYHVVFKERSVTGDLTNEGDYDVETNLIVQQSLFFEPFKHGTFHNNPDGWFIYTPNQGFIGLDTSVLGVCDQGTPLPAECKRDTIFVNVVAPRTANDDNNTELEDTQITFDILSNDYDPFGFVDPSTVDLDPSVGGIQTSKTTNNGTWSVTQNDANITFIPNNNYCGVTTVTYTHGEGSPGGRSNIATVTLNLDCVNDPPEVDNEHLATQGSKIFDDLINAGDFDIETNVVVPENAIVQDFKHGVLMDLQPNGEYAYQPYGGFQGLDTAVVLVCDQGFPMPASCVHDTIFVFRVSPGMPLPSNGFAEDSTAYSARLNWDENGNATMWNIEIMVAGTKPTGHPTNTTSSKPFTISGLSPLTTYDVYLQSFVSQETSPYAGPFKFTTEAVPEARNDTETGFEDTQKHIDILSNDVESAGQINPATVDLDQTISGIQSTVIRNNATWTVDQNNGFLICTPKLNYCGTTSISYTFIEKRSGNPSNVAMVELNLACVNDPPVVDNERIKTRMNTSAYGDLTNEGDYDVETSLDVGVVLLRIFENGVSTLNNDGTFVYTPNNNFIGSDTATAMICDKGTPQPVMCVIDTIFLTVLRMYPNPSGGNSKPSPGSGSSSFMSTTSAQLNWTENGGATNWNVELVQAGSAPSGVATHSNVTNPFTVTNLTTSIYYDFYVQSVHMDGTSDYAGPFTFLSNAIVCTEPNSLLASNVTGNSALLSWMESTSVLNWEVYVAPTGGPAPTTIPTYADLSTKSIIVQGLEPSTNYEFFVRANCGNEMSAWQGPELFSTKNAGIVEEKHPMKLTISPNPSDGLFVLTIEGLSLSAVDLEVVNYTGQSILSQSGVDVFDGKEIKLNLSNEPSGVYFVRLTTNTGIAIEKIILN